MTWVSRPSGDGRALDLLVLWRGRPGWFFAQPHTSVTDTHLGVFRKTFSYGDVELALEFTSRTREAVVAGHVLSLEADNVVLVDDVDGEPRIAGRLRIDPALPATPGMLSILGRSPAIIDFLRCGISVGDDDRDTQLAQLCALAGGGG